jgi:hypothetical protein
VVIAAAVATVAGCGGAQEEPPALPGQVGVVREFRGELDAGDTTRPIRYWLLEEEGGGRRARVRWGGDEPRDVSSRLTPSGGEVVTTGQVLVISADEPAGTIVGSGPEPVPLSIAGTAFSLEFHRELVRLGEALAVEGSAGGGCTDYAAPLITHALGILDSAAAREEAAVSTLDGSPSAVTIRLCGPERELSRISAPAYRLTLADGEGLTRPAEVWQLALVRRRPATARLIADTFDLARAYPEARVDPRQGGVGPPP